MKNEIAQKQSVYETMGLGCSVITEGLKKQAGESNMTNSHVTPLKLMYLGTVVMMPESYQTKKGG